MAVKRPLEDTIVSIGEINIDVLIRNMISISKLIGTDYKDELKPRDVKLYSMAVQDYLRLDANHWITKKYPNPDIIIEAYRKIENFVSSKPIEIK